ALVDIGRSRGKQVLAEGVETQEDHNFVCRIGANLVQGFFYGKPSPNPKPNRLTFTVDDLETVTV
ncbi:MAG: EAL domain-containing protein, partial [Leptolyngbya sp. SIO3F4]|nr:EAL domain-containing protein [Leptolyngbya sp. SIO3F4]